jgi:hypothetical protein
MNIKLDTGVDVSIIPLTFFNKINKQFNVRPTDVTLQSFQGNKVKPVGIVNLHCKFKDTEVYIDL